MNFACDRCGRLYSVADDKVRGRPFRVKCKACSQIILVRSHAPARAPAPGPGAGAPTARMPRPSRAHAPAIRPSMSDEEMAWLADGAQVAKAATSTAEDLPPLPIDDESGPSPIKGSSAVRSSPRRFAVAAAATLSALVAAGTAAWFASGRHRAAPPPPPAAEPAPPAAPAAQQGPEAAASASPAPQEAAAPAENAPSSTPTSAPQQPALPTSRLAGPRPPARDPGAGRVRNLKIARKDLKLLDLLGKKEDVVPPEATDKAILDTGRAQLDPQALQRTFSDHLESFAACVSRAAQADPKKRLRAVTVTLTVQPSGVVSSASLGEPNLDRTALGRCIVSTTRRIVFPAFQGDPHEVSIPLSLSAIR